MLSDVVSSKSEAACASAANVPHALFCEWLGASKRGTHAQWSSIESVWVLRVRQLCLGQDFVASFKIWAPVIGSKKVDLSPPWS